MAKRIAAGGPHRAELWGAAAVFAVLTIVFTYPLSVRPGTAVLADQPDVHLFLWTLGWIAHSLVTDPLGMLDANIFHPLRYTFAFSENLLGSGLFVAPVIWLTGNHVLAANLVSLTSVLLCGVGAYLLARRVGLSVAAAYICGIIFAFSPPRFFRLSQLHLTAVQWMPFTLAYLHSYFDRGRPRDLRIAAGFFALQALASGHGAVFLAVAVAGLFIYRAAVERRLAVMQRVRDLGWTGLLLLAPAILAAVPYRLLKSEIGRGNVLENWTVPAVSFIASPSKVHQAIISMFVPLSRVNDVAHAYLFPGYIPLVLAVVALAFGSRRWLRSARTDPTLFYGLLALVSLLFTVGPPLGLWPVFYWMPGFNFIRVPSRFLILTVLALAVLGGIAVDRLMGRLKPAPTEPAPKAAFTNPGGISLAVALGVLLLVEFSTIPIDVTPFSTRPPAADRWLADQPKPFVVAEIPVYGAGRDQSVYMLHSMAHWQKTVHGFSGFDPAGHMELYASMRRFPSPQTLDHLRSFGVTHVVVHVDRYGEEQWAAVEEQLPSVPDLELVFQEMKSRVYRLRYDPGARR